MTTELEAADETRLPAPMGVLYRYVNYGVSVVLLKYPIIKNTPKGCWVRDYSSRGDRRHVCNNTRKRFAFPTAEEARVSFVARKRRQIKILQAQLDWTRKALGKAERNEID